MQRFVGVKSTAPEVKPLETTEYHVILNNGITEVHEEATDEMESGFNGFEIAEQIIYSKDEYIELLTEQNSTLTTQVTDLQLALCDVYEATLV